MLKKGIIAIILISLPLALTGDIEFSSLDLTSGDVLSFNMKVENPGYGSYDTLFITDLNTGELKQLTFFPEKVSYLSSTGEFQIQNRYGVFRTDNQLSNFKALNFFSSFLNTNKIERGKLLPIQGSPDGKYLVYIKPKNNTFGDLALFNVATSKETVISNNIEITLGGEIALWSDDSRFIIYPKEGNIYYYSMEHLSEDRVFVEDLRKIGKGVLKNVRWGPKNELYYVSDYLVYRIGSREFFTRAFYKDILRIGVILGKIPFNFDPNFDSFWIAPEGDKILFNKGGRNLFLYFLQSEDFISTGDVMSLPYLYLPRNTTISRVIWSDSDKITVLASGIANGSREPSVFRLTIPSQGESAGFIKTDDQGVKDILLSPDDQIVALLKEKKVEFRRYDDWTLLHTLVHEAPLNAIWKNDREIFIAGANYTELFDVDKKSSQLISFSQAREKSFSQDEKNIIIKARNKYYSMPFTGGGWSEVSLTSTPVPKVVSNSYRAYLADSTYTGYANMIMVRKIKADTFGTFALFESTNLNHFEPFPEKEEKIDFENFTHGSRIRRREIALVFDVVDSIEGLPYILSVLSDYNLKCTFFINGEAIKRYSGAVKEIANSGHEVGSLFYAYFNMIDSKYDLDKRFIKSGLAINEDDFFGATGKELALLWHAPYYFINSAIIAASKEMGYTYVGRDIDAMDWVTQDAVSYSAGIYLSASKLVETILETKKPGSIIPIMVGLPKGEREDYLFQKLDILINSLLNKGYTIVPVSTLIEHAK